MVYTRNSEENVTGRTRAEPCFRGLDANASALRPRRGLGQAGRLEGPADGVLVMRDGAVLQAVPPEFQAFLGLNAALLRNATGQFQSISGQTGR